MAHDELPVLDSSIRLWVIIPIIIIALSVGLGRHYVSQLIQTPPKSEKSKAFQTQAMMRSSMLCQNARFLPRASFGVRKVFFNSEHGLFRTKRPEGGPQNPATDPSMMTNMLKGQMVNMLPYIGMGYIINHVFSGFVITKVPFPLTLRFKSMLLRGIELPNLSSSWVSSASFYFLNLFGLRSIFTLVLGANNDADSARAMQQQMAGAGMGGPQDPGKAFDQARETLELVQHEWAMENVEPELLKIFLS